MAAPAYLPLFGSDYLADTRHLTTEEHGAYLLLMIAAWRQDDCGLPNDDKKLARIVGLSPRKWGAIKDTILEFWTQEDGRIFQARLRKERAFADQKSEGNRRSARARWDKQPIENNEGEECERISECNAPQPQPHIEPNGSKKTKNAGAKAVPVQLPENWEPAQFGPGTKSRAVIDGWPPGEMEAQLEHFTAHHCSKGNKFKDWQDAWSTWVLNSRRYGVSRNDRSPTTGRQSSASREGDGFTRTLDLVDAALARQRSGDSSWAS